MKYALLIFSLLISALPTDLFGQAKLRLKPKEIRKMSWTDIHKVDGSIIPISYLYQVKRNSITLMKNPMNKATNERMFITKAVDLDDIDYMVVYDKRVKAKRMVLGGVLGGTLAYFITKALQKEDHRQVNIEIIGQPAEPNFFEPMVATGFGIGIGIAVGEWLSPIRIQVQKNRREASKKLRQFSFR